MCLFMPNAKIRLHKLHIVRSWVVKLFDFFRDGVGEGYSSGSELAGDRVRPLVCKTHRHCLSKTKLSLVIIDLKGCIRAPSIPPWCSSRFLVWGKFSSLTCERATTELSSLIASSVISLLGLTFSRNIAVPKSSFLKWYKNEEMCQQTSGLLL